MRIINFILFLFVVFLILEFIPSAKHHKHNLSKTLSNTPPLILTDTIATINISAVGDIMCHSTQYKYAKTKLGKFNFNPLFRYLKEYFTAPDLMLGNFESVVAKEGATDYSGYPRFNTPPELIDALKENGFDILFTSNNHAYDRGEKGVLRTIKHIKKNNILSLGTNLQKSKNWLYINIKGIKIALHSYTYGINGFTLPEEKNYLVNIIDTTEIKKNLTESNKKNPDITLVYLHIGEEYLRKTTKYQRNIIEKAFLYGADIILCSHPHVIQPVKMVKLSNSKIDSGFVAYSLGNFISNQRWRYSDASVILNFSIQKNIKTKKIILTKISYIPLWVFKGKTKQGNEYVILPAEMGNKKNMPYFITPQDSSLMVESFLDTKDIINKETKRINLLSITDTLNKVKSYYETLKN